MGNCCGRSASSYPVKRRAQNAAAYHTRQPPTAGRSRTQHDCESRLVLKLLAEVNTLCSDHGPLRWQPVFYSLVPLCLFCVQEGEVYVYEVSAVGVDGFTFSTRIRIPGTKIRKTSQCFVQWRDTDKGGAWGLNFMSEADTIQFLNGCSPPATTPLRLRHALSTLSLSLPIPSPPARPHTTEEEEGGEEHNGTTALDSIVMQDSPTVELCHRTLDASTPPNTSGDPPPPTPPDAISHHSSLALEQLSERKPDIRRYTPPLGFLDAMATPRSLDSAEHWQEDEAGLSCSPTEDNADSPQLFQPSLPVQTTGFILPNIEEESEEGEVMPSSYEAAAAAAPFSFEDVGLEEIETSFNDRSPLAHSLCQANQVSTPLSTPPPRYALSADPPILPLSPPPGPLLSPSALQDRPAANSQDSTLLNRQSALLDDTPPPPLPTSLPPGKLISPRHSLLLLGYGAYSADDLETTLKEADCRLDLSILLSKLENLRTEPATEKEEVVATQELSVASTDEGSDTERGVSLPPPVDDGDTQDFIGGSGVALTEGEAAFKLPQSFLEPPIEFSDSGFTDTENTPHSRQWRKGGAVFDAAADTTDLDDTTSVSTLREDAGLPRLPPQSFTSDDRLTEYSGSVGPKTNASSGSQPSLVATSSRDKLEEEDGVTAKRWEAVKRESTVPLHLLEVCKPAIRKTGWLEAKTMLVRKNRKVAMKSKRRWKKFWATLKGASLLLYQCDEESALREDAHVDQTLDLELSLVHAVNDHPKRDHIFCLSTSAGNTHYLQTKNQSEVDDWMTTIHCAAAMAATHQAHKDEAVKILKGNIDDINRAIEKETQLKNLTELKLASASDYATKTMASKQLSDCCENIEKHSIELYRTRCYTASLQGTELPNPQSLLGSVSKHTKLVLGRVGIFSVGSLHAIVSARQKLVQSASSLSLKLKASPSSSPKSVKPMTHKRKSSSLSRVSEKQPSKRSLAISPPLPLSTTFPRLPSRHFQESHNETTDVDDPRCMEQSCDGPPWQPWQLASFINTVSVQLPNGRQFESTLRNDMTAREVLGLVCERSSLKPEDHFLRLTLEGEGEEFEVVVARDGELFVSQEYVQVELCQKFVHSLTLTADTSSSSSSNAAGFGLTLVPDSPTAMRALSVGGVQEGGVAAALGVREGDEVVLLNDRTVAALSWGEVTHTLTGSSVSLTLRTCHVGLPLQSADSTTNQIMESLICPAPPSHAELSGDVLDRLIIPQPSAEELTRFPDHQPFTELSQDQIDVLMKDSHELSKLLRTWKMQQPSGAEAVPMTTDDRLRKSARELVETEQEYVRFLTLIMERYLLPLKEESVLPQEEVDNLTANIPQIISFQKQFLKTLEEALSLEPVQAKSAGSGRSVLKNVVLAIAEAFRYHAIDFRQYSTFCDSHHRAQRIVARVEDAPLQLFLEVRNPHRDRSLRFEALLAKPILRVSKYLLFLNAIMDHTPQESEERGHLKGAIEAMIKVLDYLNEMQRLCEMYSSLFEAMLKASPHTEFGVGVKLCHLKHQEEVIWLNPADETLAKGWRKGAGPDTLCFVFSTCVILLCLDKKLKRKSSKPSREIEVTSDELSYKVLLPCLQCWIHELPDSDGVTNMLRLQFKRKPGTPVVNYLFRTQSPEKKAALTRHLRTCIKEQQRLYGNHGPLRAASRSSPSLSPFTDHPSPLPPSHHHPRLHRVTSPPPSMASGYLTSDTDWD